MNLLQSNNNKLLVSLYCLHTWYLFTSLSSVNPGSIIKSCCQFGTSKQQTLTDSWSWQYVWLQGQLTVNCKQTVLFEFPKCYLWERGRCQALSVLQKVYRAIYNTHFNTTISLLNSKHLSVFHDIKTQSTSPDPLHFLQHHKAAIILPNHIQQLVSLWWCHVCLCELKP
jgi:hypothetical protein